MMTKNNYNNKYGNKVVILVFCLFWLTYNTIFAVQDLKLPELPPIGDSTHIEADEKAITIISEGSKSKIVVKKKVGFLDTVLGFFGTKNKSVKHETKKPVGEDTDATLPPLPSLTHREEERAAIESIPTHVDQAQTQGEINNDSMAQSKVENKLISATGTQEQLVASNPPITVAPTAAQNLAPPLEVKKVTAPVQATEQVTKDTEVRQDATLSQEVTTQPSVEEKTQASPVNTKVIDQDRLKQDSVANVRANDEVESRLLDEELTELLAENTNNDLQHDDNNALHLPKGSELIQNDNPIKVGHAIMEWFNKSYDIVQPIVTTNQIKESEVIIHDRLPDSIDIAQLSPEQQKFIEDEASMLLVADDDIVLGKMTEEAIIQNADFHTYIYYFKKSQDKLLDRVKRVAQGIDKLIEYDRSFDSVPVINISDAMSEAFSAVTRNDISSLRVLLDSSCIMQKTNDERDTLLHQAVEHDNYQLTRFLLMRGINVKVRNAQHYTAFDLANEQQNDRIKKLLLQAEMKIARE